MTSSLSCLKPSHAFQTHRPRVPLHRLLHDLTSAAESSQPSTKRYSHVAVLFISWERIGPGPRAHRDALLEYLNNTYDWDYEVYEIPYAVEMDATVLAITMADVLGEWKQKWNAEDCLVMMICFGYFAFGDEGGSLFWGPYNDYAANRLAQGPYINWAPLVQEFEADWKGELLYVYDAHCVGTQDLAPPHSPESTRVDRPVTFRDVAAWYTGPEMLAGSFWKENEHGMQRFLIEALLDKLKQVKGEPCCLVRIFSSLYNDAVAGLDEHTPTYCSHLERLSTTIAPQRFRPSAGQEDADIEMAGAQDVVPDLGSAAEPQINTLVFAQGTVTRILLSFHLSDSFALCDGPVAELLPAMYDKWGLKMALSGKGELKDCWAMGSGTLVTTVVPVEVWAMLRGGDGAYEYVETICEEID